ncbi:MAG: amidase, partial [Anaerolineae bacterium]
VKRTDSRFEEMLIHPAPLAETAAALRSGELELTTHIDEICDRIDAVDPQVQALLPEPDRRTRLRSEAAALQARFPDPASRPPLFGVLVGVKDIFRVEGFPTRAGSQFPPEALAGPETACVTTLRQAGALILGKTVTTEFAYFEPGPTRNPHNLDHTPGGSSSGSAAAVAAGLCPLATGTQTIGSVIRPAAFCGIVGFKPSYGRISTEGLILFSESVDHIGLFTQDVAGMELAASVACLNWRSDFRGKQSGRRPVLGVPDGPYLTQASPEALSAFEEQLAQLEEAGYTLRTVGMFDEIELINRRHRRMIAAEMAQVHAEWFRQYEALYRPRTAEIIRDGQTVSADELAAARAGRGVLRDEVHSRMQLAGIDLWVSPAAPGPAPEGIHATGDPAMNLPWTYAGLPSVTVPAGRAGNGLPLGLQLVAPFMADEQLLAWAAPMADVFARLL